ncbi:Phosphatase 2C family protein [Rhynchospora pubera]|uniref:protein-serine/threonine phosphatase n=1 Tax=Rhynchospora pubera TaxID=906938 RepID=A0AAV8GH24_9POAL|nr:Phosphatase 2C family protein [Rhynchospora pubera]
MAERFVSRLFGGPGSDDNPLTSIHGHQCKKRHGHRQREKKLASHLYGQYSMALVKANARNEDRCQLVSGPLSNLPGGPIGVFVGIYDGHAGNLCSQFVLDNHFDNLKTAFTNQHGHVNCPVAIVEAYSSTEDKFVEHARENWQQKPKLASAGSCCLSAVVHNNVLYVANAGDSRAVLAKWGVGDEDAEEEQLSIDYTTQSVHRRRELQDVHFDDPDLIKVNNYGIYRVRGCVQVTRAIGDVYLKFNEFNQPPLKAQYRQQQSIVRPILRADPTGCTHPLGPRDKFVIFGSRGLWRGITNDEAVSLVKASPRSGAARALLIKALDNRARRHNLVYEDLKNQPLATRQNIHDDISIVILFFGNLPAENQ